MRKCFSMLLGAGIIALLTSCNFAAIPNDGTLAEAGLNHYVDWSKGDGGDSSGGGGGTSGTDTPIFAGCQIWAEGDSANVDFNDSEITCYATSSGAGWFGIAFGQIADGGTGYTATTDMSKVSRVTFSVSSAAVGSQYTIKIAEQEVTTGKRTISSGTTDLSLEITDPSNFSSVEAVFVVVGEGGHRFNSAANALKITNIKFIDENNEVLKTLPTTRK